MANLLKNVKWIDKTLYHMSYDLRLNMPNIRGGWNKNKILIKSRTTDIPKALAYLEGELFDNYIHDMKIVQQYATYNRKAMAEDMIEALGLHISETFTTISYG